MSENDIIDALKLDLSAAQARAAEMERERDALREALKGVMPYAESGAEDLAADAEDDDVAGDHKAAFAAKAWTAVEAAHSAFAALLSPSPAARPAASEPESQGECWACHGTEEVANGAPCFLCHPEAWKRVDLTSSTTEGACKDEEPVRVPVEVTRRTDDEGTLSFAAPGFTTVRICRHCGVLLAGGPTACPACARPGEKG